MTAISKSTSKNAFTLIELLVVISIISLLISILLPVLQHARGSARTIVCLSKQRQLGLGMVMYADANKDRLPLSADANVTWARLLHGARIITYDRSHTGGNNNPYFCPSGQTAAGGYAAGESRSYYANAHVLDDYDGINAWISRGKQDQVLLFDGFVRNYAAATSPGTGDPRLGLVHRLYGNGNARYGINFDNGLAYRHGAGGLHGNLNFIRKDGSGDTTGPGVSVWPQATGEKLIWFHREEGDWYQNNGYQN